MKTDRGTTWSITINNPIKADDDNIGLAKTKGWKVLGQKEKGENGTEHYQLMVKTPQVRFSAVKKAFPRAHIELARNSEALEQYVTKDDTRVGGLPTNSSYLSLNQLWEKYAEWIDEHRLNMAKESWDEDQFLDSFDMFIRDMIIEGFNVETMAVNPQVRGCVKKFGREIIIRAQNIRRQTDSQTQEIFIPTIEDKDAGGKNDEIESCSSQDSQEQSEYSEDYQDSQSETDEGSTKSECFSSSSSYD